MFLSLEYIAWYSVLLCCSVDLTDSETLGIASIFKHLVMMFPSVCLASLPAPLYISFIERLQTLTCAFGRQAALEEEVNTLDTFTEISIL